MAPERIMERERENKTQVGRVCHDKPVSINHQALYTENSGNRILTTFLPSSQKGMGELGGKLEENCPAAKHMDKFDIRS